MSRLGEVATCLDCMWIRNVWSMIIQMYVKWCFAFPTNFILHKENSIGYVTKLFCNSSYKRLSKCLVFLKFKRWTGCNLVTAHCDFSTHWLFLVRIFLYSVQIQENTNQKWLRIWTIFHAVTAKWNAFFYSLLLLPFLYNSVENSVWGFSFKR